MIYWTNVNFILLSLTSTIFLVCLVLCLLMRLNQHQIDTLKRIGSEVFGTKAKLMLFGSRTNDNRRGGDIDLYVTGMDQTPEQLFDAKLDFLVKAKRALGEQRIDVVFSPAPLQNPEPIHMEAQRTGIPL